MLLPRSGTFVRITVAIIALGALGACSAEDASGPGGRGSVGAPAFGPGAPTAGVGGASGTGSHVGTAGSSSTDPFGNTTNGPPPMPVDLGPGGDDCLEATVAFVVDGSGSMCEPFGASTRWGELRKALLAPDMGVLYRLQSQADFGMTLYDGSIDPALLGMMQGAAMTCNSPGTIGRLMATDCMQLISVQPTLNNADAIAAMFPMQELGGSTPTDRALNLVIDGLIGAQAGVDLKLHPQFILLATDGQPNDICVGGAGGDGIAQQNNVIAAVDRAAASFITTFVISLAGTDAALQAHLDQVAIHGNPADPAAHTFSPMNPEELQQALLTVLGNALGCNVL